MYNILSKYSLKNPSIYFIKTFIFESCNIIVFTYYNIICTNIFFVALILSENISFIHNKGYLPNELHLSSMHIMIISWAVFSHGNWYAIKDNKCHFRVMYLFRSRHQLFRKYKLPMVNTKKMFLYLLQDRFPLTCWITYNAKKFLLRYVR